MSKIEQLIKELCPGGVKYKPLKEIGTLIRGNGLQKSDFIDFGYGCIHYGQIYTRFGMFTDKVLSYVSDELAQKLTKVEPGNVILACTSENVEDVCKSVVWLGNKTIVTGGHATVFKHNQNPKYIGYCLNTENFFNQKRKYAYGAKVIDIKIDKLGLIQIPLPPLAIQEEIVRILDTFTEAQANLEQELELRKKQYEYYRNQLLTFNENDNVRTVQLRDVTKYSKSRIPASELSAYNYVSVENLLPNKQGKTLSSCCPISGNWIEYFPNDILIGNIRPYLRKIWFSNIHGGTNGDVLAIHIIDENVIFPPFLYQICSSEDFFEYDNKHSSGAKMPRGDKDAVMKYSFTLPSLKRQQEIVSILDKFESVIQTLEEELALRKMQYEYYREKLLSYN